MQMQNENEINLIKIISQYFNADENDIFLNKHKLSIGNMKYIILKEDELYDYWKLTLGSEFNRYSSFSPYFLEELTGIPKEAFLLLCSNNYEEIIMKKQLEKL